MEKALIKFEEYILKKNLRMTDARRIILSESLDFKGHFTANELLKKCQNKQTGVSRASVYRMISDMLESGLVRQTAYGEKHNHYEWIRDKRQHYHARCLRCNNIQEFTLKIKGMSKQINDCLIEKGFSIIGHEFHIYGICEDCKEQE